MGLGLAGLFAILLCFLVSFSSCDPVERIFLANSSSSAALASGSSSSLAAAYDSYLMDKEKEEKAKEDGEEEDEEDDDDDDDDDEDGHKVQTPAEAMRQIAFEKAEAQQAAKRADAEMKKQEKEEAKRIRAAQKKTKLTAVSADLYQARVDAERVRERAMEEARKESEARAAEDAVRDALKRAEAKEKHDEMREQQLQTEMNRLKMQYAKAREDDIKAQNRAVLLDPQGDRDNALAAKKAARENLAKAHLNRLLAKQFYSNKQTALAKEGELKREARDADLVVKFRSRQYQKYATANAKAQSAEDKDEDRVRKEREKLEKLQDDWDSKQQEVNQLKYGIARDKAIAQDKIKRMNELKRAAAKASVTAMKDFLQASSEAKVMSTDEKAEEKARVLAAIEAAKVIMDKLMEKQAMQDARRARDEKDLARNEESQENAQMQIAQFKANQDAKGLAKNAGKALAALKKSTMGAAKELAKAVKLNAEKMATKLSISTEKKADKTMSTDFAAAAFALLHAKEYQQRIDNLKEAPPYMAPYVPLLAAELAKAAIFAAKAKAAGAVRDKMEESKHKMQQDSAKSAAQAERARQNTQDAEIKGLEKKSEAEADLAAAALNFANKCKAKEDAVKLKLRRMKAGWEMVQKLLLESQSETAKKINEEKQTKVMDYINELLSKLRYLGSKKVSLEKEGMTKRDYEKEMIRRSIFLQGQITRLTEKAMREEAMMQQALAELKAIGEKKKWAQIALEQAKKATKQLEQYLLRAHLDSAMAQKQAGAAAMKAAELGRDVASEDMEEKRDEANFKLDRRNAKAEERQAALDAAKAKQELELARKEACKEKKLTARENTDREHENELMHAYDKDATELQAEARDARGEQQQITQDRSTVQWDRTTVARRRAKESELQLEENELVNKVQFLRDMKNKVIQGKQLLLF